LKDGFSDVSIEDILLWSQAKIANNPFVKQVVNDANKFDKVLKLMIKTPVLNSVKLTQYHKILQPKNKKFAPRLGMIKVGDPQLADYAFYAPPKEQVEDLLTDVFTFIQSPEINMINKALISMMQFFFIHPFNDGNGRVFRAVSLSILQQQLGLTTSYILILYFKNINVKQYYLAQKSYREGNMNPIKTFHKNAIDWTNKSALLLAGLLKEYTAKVDQQKVDQDNHYSQIVIKANQQHTPDAAIFTFHSKKGQNNIYINTPLRSCLNQFDYYLRHQLREHQVN